MVHQGLLGGARSDAGKTERRHIYFQFLAEFHLLLDAPRISEGDFLVLVGCRFDNQELGEDLDVAGFLVDHDAQVAKRPNRLLGRGEQRLPHGANGNFTVLASVILVHNDKVSDRSQPPVAFDLYLSEPAGSGSLDRRVR